MNNIEKLIEEHRKNIDESIKRLSEEDKKVISDLSANKYKDFFNGGLSQEQKEELEQLWIKKAPECQFAKYGFEVPEFECEILKKRGSWLVGYMVISKGMAPVPCMWFEHDGNCSVNNYNLAPIKKPWYEDESNFPCVVIIKKTKEPIAIAYSYDGTVFRDRYKSPIQCPSQIVRAEKKEEVLSLYKEDS